MTFFEALTGGAFDRLKTGNIAGELDQNFSKKSNAPGGRWAVLELTGTERGRYIRLNISPRNVLQSRRAG